MIWTIILRFAIQDISVEGEMKNISTALYSFLSTWCLLNADMENGKT